MIQKILILSITIVMLSSITYANGEDIPRLYSNQTQVNIILP